MVGFARKVIISKYSVFSSLPIKEREGIYNPEANFFYLFHQCILFFRSTFVDKVFREEIPP